MTQSSSQQAPVQKAGEKSTPSSSSSTASGGASRKVQMVSGSASFAEGEARLRPVQMEKESGSAKSAIAGSVGGAVAGAEKATQEAGAQAGDAAKEAVGDAKSASGRKQTQSMGSGLSPMRTFAPSGAAQ